METLLLLLNLFSFFRVVIFPILYEKEYKYSSVYFKTVTVQYQAYQTCETSFCCGRKLKISCNMIEHIVERYYLYELSLSFLAQILTFGSLCLSRKDHISLLKLYILLVLKPNFECNHY